MVRVSVAMAVCNGEQFLTEQIESIIKLMNLEDELVISYDSSNDNTLRIIKDYENKDTRIHVVYDNGHSVESNFNNAVANCNGKYIFLSDQDDVWINDKINVMVNYFEEHEDCVVLISDGYNTDKNLNITNEMFDVNRISTSPIKNFIKGTYLGCQMAFRSRIRDQVWPVRVTPPIPHDLWLGVQGARFGKVSIIKDKLIMHRLHGDNFSSTSKMNIIGIVKNRGLFFMEFVRRGNKTDD